MDWSQRYLAHYRDFGYAIVKGVFNAGEIARLAAACDRVETVALAHPKSYRHQNTFYRIAEDERLGRVLRFAQWPAYGDPDLEAVRLDHRLFEIAQPLLGNDIRQIINQVNWKPPGAAEADFCFHQDIHFRRPRAAYRNTRTSYVQTAIAVDPHRRDNGAIRVYPGSHKLGRLDFPVEGRVMNRGMSDADLSAVGLDPGKLVDLELEPGDVALWNLYTVHGSGPNRSTGGRRVYLNGYVRAEDCDRGEWAFRDGQPCRLGEPVLVHFEDLYHRPEPHYVED